MEIKDRIKAIRKEKKLTQVEFGETIGVKGNTVTNYETGLRIPTDAVIKSICREFSVNENWLRTGEGEMLISTDRNADLAKLTRNLLDTDDDSYKKRLISVLANLTEDQWQTLADIADKFAKEKD